MGVYLKYCVQFWSLYYRQDIVEIEKVQWRATKMIQDLGDMNDEDKLAGFKLCYLRTGIRRMPGGSCLGTLGFACPGITVAAPQDSGRRGASCTATAQRDISGLAATSCGSSK